MSGALRPDELIHPAAPSTLIAMRRSSVSLALFCVLLLAAACGSDDGSPTQPSPPVVQFSSTDLRVGTGAEAVNGSRLTVNYTGWLYSVSGPENKGQQIDSSAGRGPFSFTLGANQVIRGWDAGLAGMRVGGLRRLVIPPELAYGAAGNGPVPPNWPLIFDVELVSVE